MTTILSLPSGPEPKMKTVNYRPKNLGEHLLAFLCANNEHGYLSPEEENLCAGDVVSIVTQYAQNKSTTLEHFFSVADELNLVITRMNLTKTIYQKQVRRLLARAFGYGDFKELIRLNWLRCEDDTLNLYKPFPNKRTSGLEKVFNYQPKLINPFFIEQKKLIELYDVNSPRPDIDLETFQGMLVRHTWTIISTIEQIKKNAKIIKKLSDGKLKHSDVLNLMGVAWGYKDFQELVHTEDHIGYVKNSRKLP